MSDRPIQVGDLVQIVRASCSCDLPETTNGIIFVVASIFVNYGKCWDCGKHLPPAVCTTGYRNYIIEVSRLKRIPPLDELESTKDTERLKETA